MKPSRTCHVSPTPAPESPVGADDSAQNVIFPRRKAGQSKKSGGKAGVVVTREVLESVFDMPLHRACKTLGVCATAFKKVCRKLGVMKWPYKDSHMPPKRKASARRTPRQQAFYGTTSTSSDSAAQSDASTEIAETSPEPETPKPAHRKVPEVYAVFSTQEEPSAEAESDVDDNVEDNVDEMHDFLDLNEPSSSSPGFAANEDDEDAPSTGQTETGDVSELFEVSASHAEEVDGVMVEGEDPMEFLADSGVIKAEEGCVQQDAPDNLSVEQDAGDDKQEVAEFQNNEEADFMYGTYHEGEDDFFPFKEQWQSSFAPHMCDILQG